MLAQAARLVPLLLLVLLLDGATALVGSSSSKPATIKDYSAICVIAKDENRYLREWAEYHRCLGACAPALCALACMLPPPSPQLRQLSGTMAVPALLQDHIYFQL